MQIAIQLIVWAAVLLVGLPMLFFSVECLAAVTPLRRTLFARDQRVDRPRVAVIIPAHDEEATISRTVEAVQMQLSDGDRVLVVADNCADGTAQAARNSGADIAIRNEPDRRGKGYALDFAKRVLIADPPDVVIVIDADCTPSADTISTLALQVARTGRPAQGCSLLILPPDPSVMERLSTLAFSIKNLARPTGLSRLGMPCLLNGTGMALPWKIFHGAPPMDGDTVEDMRLGLDLALAGCSPRFCPEAMVTSLLERGKTVSTHQRSRWEHGHLRTLTRRVPQLVAQSWSRRNPELLLVALELGVPPLSILFSLWAIALVAGTLAGHPAAWVLLAFGLAAVAALVAAWARFGRELISPWHLVLVPMYVLAKLPMYLGFFGRRRGTWVRASRAQSDPSVASLEAGRS